MTLKVTEEILKKLRCFVNMGKGGSHFTDDLKIIFVKKAALGHAHVIYVSSNKHMSL